MTEQDSLAELREQARCLVREVAGPLRRVQLRTGEAMVEIEWHSTGEAPAGPNRPAPPVEIGPPGQAEVVVAEQPPTDHDLQPVTSPMVGTFYRRPSADEDPFVTEGDLVTEGQTVAIVEAMKLFNPIVAECAGVVVELLVEDGKPVQFGDELMRLRVGDPDRATQGA